MPWRRSRQWPSEVITLRPDSKWFCETRACWEASATDNLRLTVVGVVLLNAKSYGTKVRLVLMICEVDVLLARTTANAAVMAAGE